MFIEVNEAIQGQRQSWNLIKKLGEGDAGEVYLVESVLNQQPAIVKRPRKSAFFSDILRQANQIKTEGSILRELPRISFPNIDLYLSTPALIDQNKKEYEQGERTFIIIEPVKGINIKQLSQIIRFGDSSLESLPSDPASVYFIDQWSQQSKFPAQLLVRVLLGVINLLEMIHSPGIHSAQGIQNGVIWNDVKPDHLYWDPSGTRLTVIDWGNGQFLESDGITKDRRYSTGDDYFQFMQEMGSFISEADPELFDVLEWPETSANDDVYNQSVIPLKEKLADLHEQDAEELRVLRQQEADLYSLSRPGMEHIDQYKQIRRQLVEHGELPDEHGPLNFMFSAAYQMADGYNLADFIKVCEATAGLPSTTADKWNLLAELAEIANQNDGSAGLDRSMFTNVLTAGIAGDWAVALWELFSHFGDGPKPEWWEKISQEIRKVCLGLEPGAISPYTMFARVYYTLQAEVERMVNQRQRSDPQEPPKDSQTLDESLLLTGEELLAQVREEIISKWKDIEPCPPNSGIGYTEVDGVINQIEAVLPGWQEKLEKSLAQPKAQVDLVLKAWERKDFELARRGLRSILVWDPDRARLFTAEKAINEAPGWLARVRQGALKYEPFYDYLTSVELAGRTLRNRMGPARWLDETLDAFKRLRRGTRSVDLMLEYPEVMQELPWLDEYQSREIITLPHVHPISLDRDPLQIHPVSFSSGVMEGKFGADESMTLAEPLDTWAPEARGSSARVFAGTLHKGENQVQSLAFKLMRSDQVDYALPLFIEEVQVLTLLRDVPGITPIVECGYIKLDEGQCLPSDESHASARGLSGQVIHFGAEQVQNFLASMDRQLAVGWIPYLALIRRESENNLLRYCDANYTHGWFLSLRDSLTLSIQICDILQVAHDRNIVYRDHKILHYYWDTMSQGVAMIDWNIARRHPQGLSDAEKQFDLVQFGARGLHHILAGRPAAGSLPLGPNRPEDIDNASPRYPVNWTYDDERLPNQVRTILEQALNQGYTQVGDIRQDLLAIYQQLPGTEKS
jgi:serine/threonine protein kinase